MSHMVRFKAITLSSFSRRVSSSVRPALNNETATCIAISTEKHSEMRSPRTLNERMCFRYFIQSAHQDFAVLDEVADMVFHDREGLRGQFVRRYRFIFGVRAEHDVSYRAQTKIEPVLRWKRRIYMTHRSC